MALFTCRNSSPPVELGFYVRTLAEAGDGWLRPTVRP